MSLKIEHLKPIISQILLQMKLNFKNYSIDVKLEKMLSNCASNMDMTKTRSKEQLNKVWEHRINQ